MNKRRTQLFRGLTSIFLVVLIGASVLFMIASTWSGKVNELLGVSDSTVKRSRTAEDYTYVSDFETASDLIQGEIDYNTRAAIEGVVALKGMPAIEGRNVTLFGMRSGEYMQFGGTMGELIHSSNVVTLADAMEDNGFSVNRKMVDFYHEEAALKDEAGNRLYIPNRATGGNMINTYYDETKTDEYNGQGIEINEVPIAEYDQADLEGYKDAAVIVLGRDAGEGASFYPGENGIKNAAEFSRSMTGNILGLSDDEKDLISYVEEQGFQKVVVLINSTSAMEIQELKEDTNVDSILWIGTPGAYGTYGIAKLLSGEYLPSGHLADTFAVDGAKSPAAQNYGVYTYSNYKDLDSSSNQSLRNSWYIVEEEGIYTGYTYYETRYFDAVLGQGNASDSAGNDTAYGKTSWNYDNEVSYTFGFGLEGSSFTEEIVDKSIDWTGKSKSTVTVKVTNTGDAAAKHVVQLYVSVPYTEYDMKNGIEKSAIQFVAYGKTGESKEKSYSDYVTLKPGESEEVTLSFDVKDLYSYDASYAHDGTKGAYVLEAGSYVFATGNGAHEAVNAALMTLHPDLGLELETTGVAFAEEFVKSDYMTEKNGCLVENQLEEADLNYWNTDASAAYLTRADWKGSFPQGVEEITATEEMKKYLLNNMYDAVKALADYDGPECFTYGVDNGIKAYDLIGLSYDDPKWEEFLDEMTIEDLYKQYISYLEEMTNVGMPKENEADSPLGLIATIGQRTQGSIYEVSEDDAAYGHNVNVYVSPVNVASTFSRLMQSEEGRLIANDALWCGYTTWYGPGMNLHRTPYNARNIAYYSEDEVLTGLTATAVINSLNTYGIITATKHFAFNDQETNRDGLSVYMNEQAAREGELRGFEMAIRDGDMTGIMTAFNRIGCCYVGASQKLINNILRGEMGFTGYVITDSIKSADYFKPIEALLAGNDRMLGASNSGSAWGFTTKSVEDDIVVQAALRESYHRKAYTYINSVMFNGITSGDAVGGGSVWWIVLLYGAMIVSGILTVVGFVFYIREFMKEGRN